MKLFISITILFCSSIWISCKTTKAINKVIAPKDSIVAEMDSNNLKDSLLLITSTLENLNNNYINFKTYNAKIKVDFEDTRGKQQDLTAIVRIVKDKAIWISLSLPIINTEVFRVLITKDSVILMNKHDKEVQYRSLDYLQEVTKIPFDYKTIQDMLLGNPVFFNESNATFKRFENFVLVSSFGDDFKNLLTLSSENNLLLHSKLDDVDINRNRTASISYDDYIKDSDHFFSTKRTIIISEKSKIDIRLNIKQFEFNKELSVAFPVPKNYKKK